MDKALILVVDDEPDIRELVKDILQDEGYAVETAKNVEEAKKIQNARQIDLVLLDIWMPGEDGISLLKFWKKNEQKTFPIVMLSGHGNVETAVEATRTGAFDFIEKPLSMEKLLLVVRQALEDDRQKKLADAYSFLAEVNTNSEVQRLLSLPLKEARELFERSYLLYQLEHSEGSISRLSNLIGMERTHLYRKLKSLGINPKESI